VIFLNPEGVSFLKIYVNCRKLAIQQDFPVLLRWTAARFALVAHVASHPLSIEI
jgi:hypothetical protein